MFCLCSWLGFAICWGRLFVYLACWLRVFGLVFVVFGGVLDAGVVWGSGVGVVFVGGGEGFVDVLFGLLGCCWCGECGEGGEGVGGSCAYGVVVVGVLEP